MKCYELNLDGLVGPTHHYAGLAFGNEASLHHAGKVSYPRAAALQGLKKMRLLHDLGLEQAFLPPPLRPNLAMLRRLGFQGSLEQQLSHAFKEAPHLLSACYSASTMWTANAATVSSHLDTADHNVHFTPANMVSQLHRASESAFTFKALQQIFNDERHFIHHPPLPPCGTLSDEGAANTNRLCAQHDKPGLQLFVYGQTSFDPKSLRPTHYPARQTREAHETNARTHGLHPDKTFFAQQLPQAIDAGVFHNDVISLANESVFLVHEEAFVEQTNLLRALKKSADFDLNIIQIPSQRLSLADAVRTYFFNSQLVTLPDQTMCLIAPIECQHNANSAALLQEIIADSSNPIQHLHFINLTQSMNNGGGPACLRLRIVLSAEALAAMHPGVRLNDALFDRLEQWVINHYRETLHFSDLCDPTLVSETQAALLELERLIQMQGLYHQ
jgi:succinylarginine dihydrolase